MWYIMHEHYHVYHFHIFSAYICTYFFLFTVPPQRYSDRYIASINGCGRHNAQVLPVMHACVCCFCFLSLQR